MNCDDTCFYTQAGMIHGTHTGSAGRGRGDGGGVVYKHLHKHEGKDTQNTTTTDKQTWGRGRFGESSGTRRRTRVSLGGEVV